MPYDICTDYVEILAGTNNKTSPAYLEAAEAVEKHNKKGKSYLRSFLTSISRIFNRTKPKLESIRKSKGSIKSYHGYDDIEKAFGILNKHVKGSSHVKNLKTIHDQLIKFESQYMDAYELGIDLLMLEYETAADTLVTGLSMCISQMCDVNLKIDKIVITKKELNGLSMMTKVIHDYAKQLSARNHKAYLDGMIASKKKLGHHHGMIATESVEYITEGSIVDSIEIFNVMIDNIRGIGNSIRSILIGVKNSVFGILPLTRAALYIHYQRKGDMVLSLEEQVAFIEQNIEQLRNRTNMDPKEKAIIIKKQQAIVEAYRKKAEKLRVQFVDAEREASNRINAEDAQLPSMSEDDDFLLEDVGIEIEDTDFDVLSEEYDITMMDEEDGGDEDEQPES